MAYYARRSDLAVREVANGRCLDCAWVYIATGKYPGRDALRLARTHARQHHHKTVAVRTAHYEATNPTGSTR